MALGFNLKASVKKRRGFEEMAAAADSEARSLEANWTDCQFFGRSIPPRSSQICWAKRYQKHEESLMNLILLRRPADRGRSAMTLRRIIRRAWPPKLMPSIHDEGICLPAGYSSALFPSPFSLPPSTIHQTPERRTVFSDPRSNDNDIIMGPLCRSW